MGGDDRKASTYAVVLSGGGARGAYEAGVISYLRERLPPELAGQTLFKVYSGTSVGAINTAFLAATAHDPALQGRHLRGLWEKLSTADIYEADVRALTGFLVKTGLFTATQFFGLKRLLNSGQATAAFPFRSVLDTTPFISYLQRNVDWAQIHRNVSRGIVDGISISATHMQTGQLALFVEKHPDVHYRTGGYFPIVCTLSPKHILASAAIPLIFPIIRINRQFYGDGSLRQSTPMSPAIHLGADRLLVISMHLEQRHRPIPVLGPNDVEKEPAVADIFGRLLNTIFLDKLDYDLTQMQRINYLINDVEKAFGKAALDAINKRRGAMRVPGKEIHPIRRVQPFVIRPSADMGAIAYEQFEQLLRRRETLTPVQRFFSRVVEGGAVGHNDFISYLMFDRAYLHTLIELGFEDARRCHEHLVRFLSGQPMDAMSASPPEE